MYISVYESQTRNRYELYKITAKKEGYPIISQIYRELANQRRETANWGYINFHNLSLDDNIDEMKVEIHSTTVYDTTIENLKSSMKENKFLWTELYPNFIQIAKNEGYIKIAQRLGEIGENKKNDYYRFQMLLDLVGNKSFLNRNKITVWKCLECGYEIASDNLDDNFECPSCNHLKPYFQKYILSLTQDNESEQITWKCMECGFEIKMLELPHSFKCPSCNRSKEYFQRKRKIYENYKTNTGHSEKALWTCLECGNEQEIEMPDGWECSICGYPNNSRF
jgi:rubrerythrin